MSKAICTNQLTRLSLSDIPTSVSPSLYFTQMSRVDGCADKHTYTHKHVEVVHCSATHTHTHTHTPQRVARRSTGKLHQVEWQVINQTSGTCNSDLSRQRSSQQCYHTLHRSTLPRPSGDSVCLCESLLCVFVCISPFKAYKHTLALVTVKSREQSWSISLDLGDGSQLSFIMKRGVCVYTVRILRCDLHRRWKEEVEGWRTLCENG